MGFTPILGADGQTAIGQELSGDERVEATREKRALDEPDDATAGGGRSGFPVRHAPTSPR
jgi:hypothetical protein